MKPNWPTLACASMLCAASQPAVGGEASGERPLYHVARVRFAIDPEETVGRRKAGLACLPAGKFRWREIDRSKDGAILTAVSLALAQAGHSVLPPADELFSETPLAPYLIAAQVELVDFDLCLPRWGLLGLGDHSKLRGQVRTKVEWSVFSAASKKAIGRSVVEISVPVSTADPGGLAGALLKGLRASAAAYARQGPLPVD